MSLTLDINAAKAADNIVTSIRESGKYLGVITRAEKLKSTQNTEGLGLSFKADDGSTADYLDIWTAKANGEELQGLKAVNALLVCLSLRGANDGTIECQKWNNTTRVRETVKVPGYPELMGKRIGLLLQKELGTHSTTGKDTEKMVIFGVFQDKTELTASEILERKTAPEKLSRMVDVLAARPVRDNRTKAAQNTRSSTTGSAAPGGDRGDPGFMDDDVPFISSSFECDAAMPTARRMAKYHY